MLIAGLLSVMPWRVDAATDVDDVVMGAARSWLADWARQEQLKSPRIDVMVLPQRRPVPSCGQALKVTAVDTTQPSRLHFSASCPDGSAQTYIVRASVRALVWSARQPIAAGVTIEQGDLKLAEQDMALRPDATAEAGRIVGRNSQRPLRAGQAVQVRFLKAGEGVRRAQAVRIVSSQHGFRVAAAGTAMQKAEAGKVVRVRNDASGRTFLARVVGPGEVEPVLGGMRAE
ncbi:flagellar basal body P-ring formation chaperone FlgA [Dyella koreensis]|uniref:Flagella basal body P-ring formation protein FlgA n=1 Tax=Dyella koreensis TaxID=311235 RepID=A0ABW8K5F2_9GAMM